MNRAELRERVRVLSGVLMDTLMSDPEADAFVNQAYLTVCGLAEWSFLYGTQGHLAAETVPALGRVQDVLHDGRTLQRRSLVDLDRFPPSRRQGAPWAWAPQGDSEVRIFPAPTAGTVTVRGWTTPAPLASDTDEPVFAVEFHDVVAYEAAASVLEAEGDDSGRTERYRGEVQSFLDRMARRYLPDGGQVAYPPIELRTSGDAGEEVPE